MRAIDHFIAGASAPGASGRFGDVFNPNTGEVQARVQLATDAELDRAVQAAVAAQVGWAATNPQRRARVMFEFKRLLERDMNSLAEILSAEHGKVIADSKGDIQRVYTDDRSLDETISVEDGDVVMVPRGYHPVGAPHGYDLYYLNVMAGPKRQWIFRNDPAHDWIMRKA